eukprot:TRINITY_DN25790_c0_g1_i1.p1 TRINITY_DN25790_c0_g1~~TRINITY_DN25790_c0_g1_i1.p1  ORF type:complete len:398 (+),score=33.59 TRINITY_DN25790_c0_g1_i1:52-1245(+)
MAFAKSTRLCLGRREVKVIALLACSCSFFFVYLESNITVMYEADFEQAAIALTHTDKYYKPNEIAFFIQSNQPSPSLNYSLISLRSWFPSSLIYLQSDGGPWFEQEASAFSLHVDRAPFQTHLAEYKWPHNFTCKGHLQRVVAAAKWAADRGARYLMIWEEDTRMVRALRRIPDVDLTTMGNTGLTHAGAWNPKELSRLEDANVIDLSPGDVRRKRQIELYYQRHGYSAGPASMWKISSLVRAYNSAGGDVMESMYAVQDLCWEEFAITQHLVIARWDEVQQIIWPRKNPEKRVGTRREDTWNLRCMECLDACKTMCGCAPSHSVWSLILFYLYSFVEVFSIESAYHGKRGILWNRPCRSCDSGHACWTKCTLRCHNYCPAVVHPHKGSTLDCFSLL